MVTLAVCIKFPTRTVAKGRHGRKGEVMGRTPASPPEPLKLASELSARPGSKNYAFGQHFGIEMHCYIHKLHCTKF